MPEFAKKFMRKSSPKSDSDDKEMSDDTRPTMKITKCPHTDWKHYAKNMCNNCYHKLGRKKMAWECPHSDKHNYAKGKCQSCYLNDYHKSKWKQPKE